MADGSKQLELIEGKVLGSGAFSRVSKVMSPCNQREYAMKRMRKSTVLQCPEHVFCEQHITRNTAHPFCIRQVRHTFDLSGRCATKLTIHTGLSQMLHLCSRSQCCACSFYA